MHWSAFCLIHWWQRNFEDAHEYRLLRASCFRYFTVVFAKRTPELAENKQNMISFCFPCIKL